MKTPNAKQNIITRRLPKTGQITSYAAGDDGDLERGWWRGRLNANNKTRFLSKTISGDDVVVDRVTGLMWPANGADVGGLPQTWAMAITWANGLTFAGFSDWRLPNILEHLSLWNFENLAAGYPQFTNFPGEWMWSSTTDSINTINAMQSWSGVSAMISQVKTGSWPAIAVRSTRV